MIAWLNCIKHKLEIDELSNFNLHWNCINPVCRVLNSIAALFLNWMGLICFKMLMRLTKVRILMHGNKRIWFFWVKNTAYLMWIYVSSTVMPWLIIFFSVAIFYLLKLYLLYSTSGVVNIYRSILIVFATVVERQFKANTVVKDK